MFSIITKALGMARPAEDSPLMPRQIDLSGNTVHFSMPENFSRDMPAEDMIESVNLSDDEVYKDYTQFTLIRRWWDFRESGFFGKEYGTLMMSLYIKKASESLNLTTVQPLDFVDIIVDDIKKNMPENPDPLSVYSDYFAAHDEMFINGQRWTWYVQDQGDPPSFTFSFAIPVSEQHYLEAQFISAPNDDIGLRGFIDQITKPFIDRIMNSFEIEYLPGNPVQQAVTNQEGLPLRQLIEKKVEQLEAAPH